MLCGIFPTASVNALIEERRVPLVIIMDWPPNGNEISQFKNWAREVMDHLSANYELSERVGITDFYRRRSVSSFR